jgi:RNA polymerase sigma factor for flagellar operon FliA
MGGTGRSLTRDDFDRWSPIVRRVAMMLGRRAPRSVSVADLCVKGFAGLIDALGSAHAMTSSADEVDAYVEHRIREAMVDHILAVDPEVRETRAVSRRIARAIRALYDATGAPPTRERIAEVMKIDLDEYEALLARIARFGLARIEVLDLDATTGSRLDDSDSPTAETLAEAIDLLPAMDRDLLVLLFQEDCSMEEAAAVVGVSQYRATLQYTETVHRLRASLGKE